MHLQTPWIRCLMEKFFSLWLTIKVYLLDIFRWTKKDLMSLFDGKIENTHAPNNDSHCFHLHGKLFLSYFKCLSCVASLGFLVHTESVSHNVCLSGSTAPQKKVTRGRAGDYSAVTARGGVQGIQHWWHLLLQGGYVAVELAAQKLYNNNMTMQCKTNITKKYTNGYIDLHSSTFIYIEM